MPKSTNVSAGLVLFRRAPGLQVFLAHPGGPFWQHRNLGAWTIPKGMINPGEHPLEAARREFQEETGVVPIGPYIDLGSVKQKGGKIVHAWAWEGDADPAAVTSNSATIEWPRGSGRQLVFPEVDRCAWFDLEAARDRILPAQRDFLDRLEAVASGADRAPRE